VTSEMCRRWAVTDGRETVGFVELDDNGAFIAIDAAGRVLGKFGSCLAASRAIEGDRVVADSKAPTRGPS
jgi:hypothetical protein